MESAVKNHLQTEAMKIRIGNNIAITGKAGNDCFIYFIGSDQINADEWTTLDLVQGQHDEIEGSPNASGLDVVMFNVNYQDTNSTNTTFYLDNLQVGDSSRGLWNGKLRFFQSWIYDNSQESNTFQLNGQSSSYDAFLKRHGNRQQPTSSGTKSQEQSGQVYGLNFGNAPDLDLGITPYYSPFNGGSDALYNFGFNSKDNPYSLDFTQASNISGGRRL